MKTVRIGILTLAALLVLGLTACGCWNGEADVVFVNCSDTPVGSVVLDSASSSQGGQNADGSPMGRGDFIGLTYEVSYPATVTVCAGLGGETPLASCTIEREPEGGRWYVTAEDGPDGMILTVGERWPLD